MKIKVEPLLPTGNYLNVRLSIEKEVPDNCNEHDEIFSVWDSLVSIHREKYPALYTKEGLPRYEGYKGEAPQKQVEAPKVSDEIQATLDEINACTEIEKPGLKSFWLKAKGNLMLSAAYQLKQKQLEDAGNKE